MEKNQLFPTCVNYRITVYFRYLIPVLLFPLLIVSCDSGSGSKKSISKQLPYLVEIENSINNEKTVGLSNLGKTIEYIPLETSPDLILGSISRIMAYKSYFIVSSDQQIYLFDTEGHFLNKIGKNGRGPGEYQTTSFCVDPYNDLICVASTPNILYFDFEGNFIDSYETGIFSSRFAFIEEDKILFSNVRAQIPPESGDTVYNWIITDRFGEVVNQIDPVIGSGQNRPPYFSVIIPLYTYDESIFFKSLYSDSLYYLENGQPKLYATFNLGKLKMDVSKLTMAEINSMNGENAEIKTLNVIDLNETDKYIFVGLNINVLKSQKCLYDKKTAEFFMLEEEVFQNDLDGGLDFWPEFFGDDGTLVGYADAVTLLNHIEGMDLSEKPDQPKGDGLQLNELKGVITEFSNPVVILVKN